MAVLAVVLSVISLVVSVYAIYRDRSRFVAFSEIVYEDDTTNYGKTIPTLRVCAVNRGARPIVITSFGFQVKRGEEVSRALLPEGIDLDGAGDGLQMPENLAQNVGRRMGDGDVYEMRIVPSDYSWLYTEHYNGSATKYFFQDIVGKRYFVKGSKQGIQTLLDNDPEKG